MPLIASEDAGLRLARAIAMDLRVYNEKKLRSGEDLTEEIEEGRELYRERVEQNLYPLFEAAIAELLPTVAQGANSTAAVTTDVPGVSQRLGFQVGLFRDEQRATKPASQQILVALFIALAVVGTAAAWFFTH